MTRLDLDLDARALGFPGAVGAAAAALADLSPVHRAAGAAVLGATDIPVATGALANTARLVVDAAGVALVVGGGAVDYAGAVHARNPFLTRGAERAEGQVTDLYLAHVQQALSQL